MSVREPDEAALTEPDRFEPNGVKCPTCGARIEWWYSGCPNRLAMNGKCRDTRMQEGLRDE